MSSNRSNDLASKVPLAALTVAFVFTLSGCPGGADLEHPDLYQTVSGGNGNTGTGGTGNTGTGGTGATGLGAVQLSVPDCPDYATVLTASCAYTGCHKGKFSQSGLDLTPDDMLAARLWNQPSQHGDIFCADIMDYCTTVPAACPTGAMLVDSADWQTSWLIAKLRGTSTGCGDPMPPTAFSPDDEKCVESVVQAIASLTPSN